MDGMLNTALYTPLELFLFVGGCFLWVILYILLIRNANTIKYVEMPILVAAANIAWEVLWSIFYKPDMGWLVVWGYRLWLVMDIYIFYKAVKLGGAYSDIPYFQKHFATLSIVLALSWFALFYFFTAAGYDTGIGSLTAYVDNLFISSLYVLLILKPQTNVSLLSVPIAWLKMLGTGMNSVMMVLHFRPEIYSGAYLLHTICGFIFVLDCLYIYRLYQRKRTGEPVPV